MSKNLFYLRRHRISLNPNHSSQKSPLRMPCYLKYWTNVLKVFYILKLLSHKEKINTFPLWMEITWRITYSFSTHNRNHHWQIYTGYWISQDKFTGKGCLWNGEITDIFFSKSSALRIDYLKSFHFWKLWVRNQDKKNRGKINTLKLKPWGKMATLCFLSLKSRKIGNIIGFNFIQGVFSNL